MGYQLSCTPKLGIRWVRQDATIEQLQEWMQSGRYTALRGAELHLKRMEWAKRWPTTGR
jgi:hypothetical protein